jgi:hypothetical protein
VLITKIETKLRARTRMSDYGAERSRLDEGVDSQSDAVDGPRFAA